MIKNIMKRQGFLSSWMDFCFVFKETSLSLPYVSCYIICSLMFVHIANCSNSRPQMFLKIGVLKTFAIFTGNTWSLRKFQSWRYIFLLGKRFQHRCFSLNTVKFLITAFFIEHLFFILIYRNLCNDRILWTSSGTKLSFLIFLVTLICFPIEL